MSRIGVVTIVLLPGSPARLCLWRRNAPDHAALAAMLIAGAFQAYWRWSILFITTRVRLALDVSNDESILGLQGTRS